MRASDIDFFRSRGYAYVGTDGETFSFIRNGFAYMLVDNGFSQGVYPVATFDRSYAYASEEYGPDHATAFDLLRDYINHYAEMNDTALFPNQITAWTLPCNQEC